MNLRKRYSRGIAVDLAYTLSRTLNDTDDINFRPVDSRAPNAEWGAMRPLLVLGGRGEVSIARPVR